MKRALMFVGLVLLVSVVSAQELNIASFNLRNNSPKDYEKNNGWNQRRDVVGEFINLKAFDVFGTQEGKKVQLDDIVARCPDYAYVGEGRDGGTKGEHCAIFYRKERVELLDSGTFWLSQTPDVVSKGWDAKYPRICTWARFLDKRSKVKFYIFNVHLDHRGVQARAEAMKLVSEYVAKRCKGTNSIVMGDFNVTQKSEPYKVLADNELFNDSYEVAKYRFAPTGTFNGFNPNCYTTLRIDHLFATKDISVNRYGILDLHYYLAKEGDATASIKSENREIKTLSDHHPVQVWVLLKGAKKNR